MTSNIIENDFIPYIVNANTILDIGANVGDHTILYSKLNSNANIYSFEPQTKLYALLEMNLKTNNINNVTILNNAVGNEIKKFRISDDDDDVPMVTIDCLNLIECDLINIKADRFVKKVIDGAINTIKKFHPVIFYESKQNNIHDMIKSLGNYEIREINSCNFIAT